MNFLTATSLIAESSELIKSDINADTIYELRGGTGVQKHKGLNLKKEAQRTPSSPFGQIKRQITAFHLQNERETFLCHSGESKSSHRSSSSPSGLSSVWSDCDPFSLNCPL